MTKLCFIGNEVTSDKKLLAGVFNICEENDTRIYTISVSASGNNITIIIDENKTDIILKSLHKKFLKKEECYQ